MSALKYNIRDALIREWNVDVTQKELEAFMKRKNADKGECRAEEAKN